MKWMIKNGCLAFQTVKLFYFYNFTTGRYEIRLRRVLFEAREKGKDASIFTYNGRG
jgi:hypothetical protein